MWTGMGEPGMLYAVQTHRGVREAIREGDYVLLLKTICEVWGDGLVGEALSL